MTPSHPAWQPIETAPKSTLDERGHVKGHYLLGFIPDPDEPDVDPNSLISVIWWEPLLDGGCWQAECRHLPKPTHWMPLPAPPAQEGAA